MVPHIRCNVFLSKNIFMHDIPFLLNVFISCVSAKKRISMLMKITIDPWIMSWVKHMIVVKWFSLLFHMHYIEACMYVTMHVFCREIHSFELCSELISVTAVFSATFPQDLQFCSYLICHELKKMKKKWLKSQVTINLIDHVRLSWS